MSAKSLRDLIVLEKDDFHRLSQDLKPYRVLNEFYLYKPGQVPILAFLAHEGEILIQHKEDSNHVLEEPILIGFHFLINNEPTKTSVLVKKGSSGFFIDKIQAKEILEKRLLINV